MRRARDEGDKVAFYELVKKYQRMIWRQCNRATRKVEIADELAQQVFLKAFDKLNSFRGEAPFGAWLCRIAFNTIRDWHRVERRAEVVTIEGVSVPVHVGYDEALSRERDLTRLRGAIETLPEKQKKVVLLRVYEAYSFKEIAVALGGTEGSAKVNFHYAMKTLKAILTVV